MDFGMGSGYKQTRHESGWWNDVLFNWFGFGFSHQHNWTKSNFFWAL